MVRVVYLSNSGIGPNLLQLWASMNVHSSVRLFVFVKDRRYSKWLDDIRFENPKCFIIFFPTFFRFFYIFGHFLKRTTYLPHGVSAIIRYRNNRWKLDWPLKRHYKKLRKEFVQAIDEAGASCVDWNRRYLIYRNIASLGVDVSEILARSGYDSAKKTICFHLRSGEYRPVFDQHDERDIDKARVVDASTYDESMASLISEGFQVVLIGDPSMTSKPVEGVIDTRLLHDHFRLRCQMTILSRCQLFVATESGPSEFGKLFGIPCIHTNIISLRHNYPLKANDRAIPQHLLDPNGRKVFFISRVGDSRSVRRLLKAGYSHQRLTSREIRDGIFECIKDKAITSLQRLVRRKFNQLYYADGSDVIGLGFISSSYLEKNWNNRDEPQADIVFTRTRGGP